MPDAETNAVDINPLLAKMESVGASDLHLKVGSPPIYRVKNVAQRIKAEPLHMEELSAGLLKMLDDEQKAALKENGSVDFAYSVHGVGRFRVSIFRQRGALSCSARRVNTKIPTVEELMLPPAVSQISLIQDGLALVVGITGSGKSTTLAALINQINKNRKAHILTIEDPIEFVYHDDKSFVNQREIGIDAPDFHIALRAALRQDPDVILLGEMRDRETMETALSAAETGHLVFGTLHSVNVVQTVGRILDFFPPERQAGMRQVLGMTLKAVIAQRLLTGITADYPRVPAVELMIVNAIMRKHILDAEDLKISDDIRAAAKDGLQDFNMSLYRLVKKKFVSEEEALTHSPNPEQLRMQLKGMVLNQDQQTV